MTGACFHDFVGLAPTSRCVACPMLQSPCLSTFWHPLECLGNLCLPCLGGNLATWRQTTFLLLWRTRKTPRTPTRQLDPWPLASTHTSHSESPTSPTAPDLHVRRGTLASWLIVCVVLRHRYGAVVRRAASPGAGCSGRPAEWIIGQKPSGWRDRRPEASPSERSSAERRLTGGIVIRKTSPPERPSRGQLTREVVGTGRRDRRPEIGLPAPLPSTCAQVAMTKRHLAGRPPRRQQFAAISSTASAESSATDASDASEAGRLCSAASSDQTAATICSP